MSSPLSRRDPYVRVVPHAVGEGRRELIHPVPVDVPQLKQKKHCRLMGTEYLVDVLPTAPVPASPGTTEPVADRLHL